MLAASVTGITAFFRRSCRLARACWLSLWQYSSHLLDVRHIGHVFPPAETAKTRAQSTPLVNVISMLYVCHSCDLERCILINLTIRLVGACLYQAQLIYLLLLADGERILLVVISLFVLVISALAGLHCVLSRAGRGGLCKAVTQLILHKLISSSPSLYLSFLMLL